MNLLVLLLSSSFSYHVGGYGRNKMFSSQCNGIGLYDRDIDTFSVLLQSLTCVFILTNTTATVYV